jgi:hypothetical protein
MDFIKMFFFLSFSLFLPVLVRKIEREKEIERGRKRSGKV